jgi:hypothetical protein
MNLRAVRVYWLDSERGTDGWQNLEHFLENAHEPPTNVTSIGLLIQESDTHITLIQSLTEEEVMNIIKIPRCSITEIDEIKWKN